MNKKELEHKCAMLEIALKSRDSEATAYEEQCILYASIIKEFEKTFKTKYRKQGCNVYLPINADRYNYLISLFNNVF